METCESCKFNFENLCRRQPPHVSIVMVPTRSLINGNTEVHPNTFAAFPSIQGDMWCGEFQLKNRIAIV